MSNDTAPRTGTPLWIKITLAASLAVNLLIVGAILGTVAARDGFGDRRTGNRFDGTRELGPLPFVAALEPKDRRALGRALLQQAEPLRQNREMLRSRFEALLGALRADEFDRATVSGLIAEQRGLAVNRQEIGERILLDHLEGLSRADRLAYAERLDKSLRRDKR